MKKLIISLILLLSAISSFAQAGVKADSSAHLSFKGIPIDGTLNEFISKLRKSGFTLLGSEEGVAVLRGDFATYKNCRVGVSTLKIKNLVSSVYVKFPQHSTWSELSSDYFRLKEMLTEKYGKPSVSHEEFQSDIQQEDDALKMYAIITDKCNYSTTYQTENGSIHLIISHDNLLRCFVRLTYYDKKNSEIVKSEASLDV